jgi:Ca-activated chloride channel family protein
MTVRGLVLSAGLVACLPSLYSPAGAAAAPWSAMQSRATIAGSVVTASLTPMAGVTVTLEQAGKVVARYVTAADGTFRFTGVAPGEYVVRAAATGVPVLTKPVRVPAGGGDLKVPFVLTNEKLEEAKVDPRGSTVTGLPQSQINRTIDGVAGAPPPPRPVASPANVAGGAGRGGGSAAAAGQYGRADVPSPGTWPGGELYAGVEPNRFHAARERPLSTFGADVDTASYTNVRRFLSEGQLPPRDAVRVEEFVNYFRFGYPSPRSGNRPIAITTEIGDCPWAPGHKLVLIGARAAAPMAREIAGRNLVLLIDVSGSMAPADRLPLLKSVLRMFADTLQPDDTLSIVTYAGSSGVALAPTPARRRDTIQSAIARLDASGSTNGAQGLITAYRIARDAYIPGGVNRVILATDGDFNVGITSQGDLLHLIERERESGVFLSVFGVGTGNLKDATMEMLADRGNGHYAYLDSLQEARRMLVREADATLETVAKDVKFQVEFNPAAVAEWKLIGYENRALAARDFNNDRKDAGEMGAGHTVTVLYEVVPVGVSRDRGRDDGRPDVDPLRYQPPQPRGETRPEPRPAGAAVATDEWLTVKVRYKAPESDTSELMSVPVRATRTAAVHLPLASAVAEFGLLLRDQPHNRARWDALERRVARLPATSAAVGDVEGFKELVAIAKSLGGR